MYEETQMVRKVRAYLSSYKTIEDENTLDEMSNRCEPSGKEIQKYMLETVLFIVYGIYAHSIHFESVEADVVWCLFTL